MLKRKNKAPAYVKPVRLPRSVQQTIPIRRVYGNAIWQLCTGEYSKSWSFSDINYAVASTEDQTAILDSWGRVLNSLAADSRLKITLANRMLNQDSLSGSLFLKKCEDGLDKYRAELNRVLLHKAKGSNGIIREKYLTLSAKRKKRRCSSSAQERACPLVCSVCPLQSIRWSTRSVSVCCTIFSVRDTVCHARIFTA